MTEQKPGNIRRAWKWMGRHKIIVGVILIAAGYGGYRVLTPTKTVPTRYALGTAQTGTVVSSVDGTGQVSASNQLDVKPQTSGTLVQLRVVNGQTVKAGDVLAVLDQKSVLTSLSQARASVESAQANYQKIVAGATATDVASSQLSVDSAQTALQNAQDNVTQVTKQQDLLIKNAYSVLLNTGLELTPGPANSSQAPTLSGAYNGTQEGQYKVSVYSTGSGLRYAVSGMETGDGTVSTTPAPLGTHGLYIQFPSTSLTSGDYWTVDIPNERAASYLSAYNSYQTALQNHDSNITSAQQAVKNAQTSLAQAQLALTQKTAPPAAADVAAAKAQVDSALAQLVSAQTAYANTLVKAPFDGQVANVSANVGDDVGGTTAIVTLITPQKLAEVPFNEVDAAKIHLGQKATLTFDAIDGLSITGEVADIQTIGTVTQGVVNYTVKINFDTQDERVRPGMSARASVITDVKSDVLTVPNGAVKAQGNQHYVEVVTGVSPDATTADSTTVTPQRQPVEIGLANDTVTEITSGLNAGDRIVTQTLSATSAAPASAARIGGGIGIPGLGGGGAVFRGGGAGGGR